MFQKFTARARKVMAIANQEAHRSKHESIDSQHLLVAIVKEGGGVGATVLRNLGIDVLKVRAELGKHVSEGSEPAPPGKLEPTPQAKQVIEYAIDEARKLNHNCVGTEHLVLAMLRQQDGIAAQVLEKLGVRFDNAKSELQKVLLAYEFSEWIRPEICDIVEPAQPSWWARLVCGIRGRRRRGRR